jgi:outer membrane lipoprotein carrier protein
LTLAGPAALAGENAETAAKAAAPVAKPAGPVTKAPAATAKPAPVAAPAREPTAAKVVEQLQKVYEQTTAIKAKFAQTLTGPTGKRQATGTVSLKKPGKMRWDYEKPEKKLFVADGTTLWVYEPEDEQAFKQSLSSSQLPTQVSFLFGRGKLLEEFEVSYLTGQTFGAPGDYVLKLVPKVATAQYRHLVFVVSPTTHMVQETVLYDQQGGTNHIVFSALELNPKSGVDDSRFSFTPPANTKIITPGR